MSESHNDVERLCETLVGAQRCLGAAELHYMWAEESDMPGIKAEHERAVMAEFEADSMLDAALDEVFAIEFAQPEPEPDSEREADEWCRIPGKGYAELQMWIGVSERARIRELQKSAHPF